jgi:hypothetical protein
MYHDTFTHKGYTFGISTEVDTDTGAPWEEADGHGVVSDWTRREKAPHERVLVSDGRDNGSKRFYDVRESMRLARKDGWGCKHSRMEGDTFVSGHKTAGELAACAVDCDFDYLRRWCNNDWYFVVVRVVLLEEDEDGNDRETDEVEYLGGVEDSDGGAYVREVGKELAEEILSRVEVDSPDIQVSEN